MTEKDLEMEGMEKREPAAESRPEEAKLSMSVRNGDNVVKEKRLEEWRWRGYSRQRREGRRRRQNMAELV